MSQKRQALEVMTARTKAKTSMKTLTTAAPKSEVVPQVQEIEMETNASKMTGPMTGAATGEMTVVNEEMTEILIGTGVGVVTVIGEEGMTEGGMMTGAVTDPVTTQAETAMTGEEIEMGTGERTGGVREMVETGGETGMTMTRTGVMPDVRKTRKTKRMTSECKRICNSCLRLK